MVRLYFDRSCPFCQRVLRYLDSTEIEWEARELSTRQDSDNRNELIELGGKSQVPFLVDDSRDVKMYESGDIIDYLEEHYAAA